MTEFNSNNIIEVPKRDFEMMLLSAFRYSLGRTTYMSGVCVEWLTKYWDIMPYNYKEQIHRDITHAIEVGMAGHDCDIAEWKKLLKLELK